MKTPPPTFRVYWGRITAAAAAAFALASIPAVLTGQWARFGAGTALVAIGALIAVLFFNLGRASAKAEQIYAQELRRSQTNPDEDPDPFAERLVPWVTPPTTYDLTVGRADSDIEPALYRGLTRTELLNRLAEHDITPKAIDVGGRHTFRGGKQLTWRPSTTDTTGETR